MAKDINYYTELGVLDWLSDTTEEQFIRFKDRSEHRFKGKLHNLNGPAVVWKDGKEEFWIYGDQFDTKETWKRVATVKLRSKKIKKII